MGGDCLSKKNLYKLVTELGYFNRWKIGSLKAL